MNSSLFRRTALTVAVFIIAAIFLAPNFLPETPAREDGEKSFLPDSRISLGLDLRGGINLTLGVDVDKALEAALDQIGPRLSKDSSDKGILVSRPKLVNGKLEFMLVRPTDREKFETLLATDFANLRYDEPQELGGRLRYLADLSPAAREESADRILDRALESIRDRIDEFGVAEPDIRKQTSGNRLIIQLPGMEDTNRALDIISRTAHLEFRLVPDKVNPKGPLPAGVELLPMQRGNTKVMLPVEKIPVLTGDQVADARAHIMDSQSRQQAGMPPPAAGQPTSSYVSLSFNTEGRKTFARVTGDNAGKRLAIILDGVIHSAPKIDQRIEGDASITGNFTDQEAADLALVLRSGSLPAPVTVLEERTVGPSLGLEAITGGVRAALFGGAAVALFMLVYYRISGLIAVGMLVLNIILILAGMAAFGATLTLPGIAGIVLTLGMAVDANVLIYERIREELARGLTPATAVNEGFSRATVAITDSNLTSIIVGVILYELGSGPIRGFAVTLTLGIIASMFTAIFVSRIVFDLWMSKPGRRLSI